jgi:hypothetical protein
VTEEQFAALSLLMVGDDQSREFPAPVARLRNGFVWTWPDIEQWATSYGPALVLSQSSAARRTTTGDDRRRREKPQVMPGST